MELREALTQISEIRLQMARTEVFRGFRAAPAAFSGLLAIAAASCQALWIRDPIADIRSYLVLWVTAAVLSAVAAGAAMAIRNRRSSSPLKRQVTWLAVEQFIPAIIAGALVTAVLVTYARDSVWMLPGLWQILFSLGMFASFRLLPRETFGVAVFYLVAGTACLMFARGSAALSPLAMGVPFGVGQLFAAAVLYWTLERSDDR